MFVGLITDLLNDDARLPAQRMQRDDQRRGLVLLYLSRDEHRIGHLLAGVLEHMTALLDAGRGAHAGNIECHDQHPAHARIAMTAVVLA